MLDFEKIPIPPRYRKRLTRAGLTSIDAIVDGLATGATAAALKALGSSETKGLRMYWRLVDWLVERGYDVDHYRNRIVCPDV